ncbi:hypothetical protein ACI79J_04235 [Geodermatophilus sp. SYSU D01062]
MAIAMRVKRRHDVRGIAEDYGDFTDIVGDAAPVLANVEKAIEQLALGVHTTSDDISAEVASLRDQVDDLASRPVQADDFGTAPGSAACIEEPPVLSGETDLATLEHVLTANALTAPLFVEAPSQSRAYRLTLPAEAGVYSFDCDAGIAEPRLYKEADGGCVTVTFDRQTADESKTDIVFLTYGTPELETLLPRNTEN